MAGILFIISAPSGSGKSTLVNEVRRLVPGLDFSVSYTTRKLRGSEEDGREYHFTTRERFEAMIAAGEFLEWAEVLETTMERPSRRSTSRTHMAPTCFSTLTFRAHSRSWKRCQRRSRSSFFRRARRFLSVDYAIGVRRRVLPMKTSLRPGLLRHEPSCR